jgi:hypothetical protein
MRVVASPFVIQEESRRRVMLRRDDEIPSE